MIHELTSEAEGDLEEIADYIAEQDPRRALSFIRELLSRCEDLVQNPTVSPWCLAMNIIESVDASRSDNANAGQVSFTFWEHQL